ncbi:MAG TPA: MauE/DoxX family redox-associated membrane protein [Ktedonobacteraceae bacterium]|nr:MauE/DoxX family redox-associated membrane protein [Ktedonobacteraceae bacterium]
MIAWYLLVFCRITIGLVFVLSFGGKVRNISEFQETILRFHLLPRRLSKAAALLFLGSELAVVVGMIAGGSFLFPAFVLAFLLLLLFSCAMISVLMRGLSTSCNCFGTSQKPVTATDIWRNVGFLLCASGGAIAALWTQNISLNPTFSLWLLAALGAGVFVLIWIQLGEITRLLSQ